MEDSLLASYLALVLGIVAEKDFVSALPQTCENFTSLGV